MITASKAATAVAAAAHAHVRSTDNQLLYILFQRIDIDFHVHL
eukprot:CAMPEP_0178452176 /NCGR_PEP_ID=MMETSP0689_2-20121128/44094_1 /TAXON_ID=160604 /ORGANISM="Amphidinium massartii, Strain CS-259" /LENGTH=42 /DNA_ID= /DNA_START= /DNA_END= /DNA_ORIENTATION=